ncbi:N-acetylmuramoyl-L-alanine amidase [Cognatiyoonia koreensis]|uniref:N-acetylmuramoyl-L-alanine amidase n=1 Tax=Cognatiyoonia koreensis TaxID=364200 RepID=A0A1I0PNW0_9RHOB|nr:N-acetylmuramoyl-L-alanine amidase [Cognatiyoonia koreensis]SEW16104.1 N-acetylmuramoyl-L-alanine amidase [Cognatiyoonia koreensis]
MMRTALVFIFCANALWAQEFSALARIDPARSQVTDAGRALQIDLHLSQTVPYRVFTLDEPLRLVLDFREVDWSGISREQLLTAEAVTDLRFGGFRPGWSRMVVDLAVPMVLETAGMTVDTSGGSAHLQLILTPTDADTFAQQAGAPPDNDWANLAPSLPAPTPDDGPLTVVIDPGHGGIDPGAERGGLIEADLMLQLGIEVVEALNRQGGVRAILTRESDLFVPLEERMTIARAAGADLFISLHADALEEDEARGASVYTLNAEGQDRAAQRMAERHERGDLLAGLDLSGTDDRVATVLMDMARAETGPKGERFAGTLVAALRENGARLNSRPRREGRLAVLSAADFASVLVEVGFLSSAGDREQLRTAEGRAPIVAALLQAVQHWVVDEATRDALIRQ